MHIESFIARRDNNEPIQSVGWAKRSVPTIHDESCGETVGTALRAFAHPTIL